MFSLGFLLLLTKYADGGVGLQFWIPTVSPGSVLIGLVHVVGLCAAVLLCFVVGSGLCAYGLVAERDHEAIEMRKGPML